MLLWSKHQTFFPKETVQTWNLGLWWIIILLGSQKEDKCWFLSFLILHCVLQWTFTVSRYDGVCLWNSYIVCEAKNDMPWRVTFCRSNMSYWCPQIGCSLMVQRNTDSEAHLMTRVVLLSSPDVDSFIKNSAMLPTLVLEMLFVTLSTHICSRLLEALFIML